MQGNQQQQQQQPARSNRDLSAPVRGFSANLTTQHEFSLFHASVAAVTPRNSRNASCDVDRQRDSVAHSARWTNVTHETAPLQ
jgi:hypothetical protein